MKKAAKELRAYARRLGWRLLRRNGKHDIYRSPSGYIMPLPGSPGGVERAGILRRN